MKKFYLLFLLASMTSCLFAQDLKTPDFFIAQIPAYPSDPKTYQQKIDTLKLIDQGIETALAAYDQAMESAEAKIDPAIVAQNYMNSMSSVSAVKGAQNQAFQNNADADTNKGGYATIMNNFTKTYKSNQALYDADMKKNVQPIDDSLLLMQGEQGKAGQEKMKQLAVRRKAAYSIIMNKYLLGGNSVFEKLLDNYKNYMLGTSIPKFDLQEKDQLKVFNLTYAPHSVALKELQKYLWQYEYILRNFKDYVE